jgi:hypothetical protein
VFVADVFDFEDSPVDAAVGRGAGYGPRQPLGVWNACRNSVKSELAFGVDAAAGDHAYTNRDLESSATGLEGEVIFGSSRTLR